MNKLMPWAVCGLVAGCAGSAPVQQAAPAAKPVSQVAPAAPKEPQLVTVDSPSPLINIKLMVRVGSAADPVGKEGLARLVATSLIQGAFGDPAKPTTKEQLADLVQPWGDDAMPRAFVAGETSTFNMTVPRDVLAEYIQKILEPMLSKPMFRTDELDRLKGEMKSQISQVRHETLEGLGLAAMDQHVNEGTGFTHPAFGTETSLPQLTQADVKAFYAAFYRPGNIIVGLSTKDDAVVKPVLAAVNKLPNPATPMPSVAVGAPAPVAGRSAIVVVEPNAPAAGIHLGFPLTINRTDDDYWPLYVAQTWFGTHRDSFGRLYQQIRQARGYNYGDYAYVEHWQGKPFSLFQIFNQPRKQQYFSIWIRPVAYEHAYHLTKAATYELARLVGDGMTDAQVEEAKKKAKVLYLNLAETVDRILAAKVDDAFYGMSPGYIEDYVRAIEAVTPARVNAAIKKHLQVEHLKYVLVTNEAQADALVDQLKGNAPAYGKSFADYELAKVKRKDGTEVWQVPVNKVDMIRLDSVWANYSLDLGTVKKVDVKQLFKTRSFISD